MKFILSLILILNLTGCGSDSKKSSPSESLPSEVSCDETQQDCQGTPVLPDINSSPTQAETAGEEETVDVVAPTEPIEVDSPTETIEKAVKLNQKWFVLARFNYSCSETCSERSMIFDDTATLSDSQCLALLTELVSLNSIGLSPHPIQNPWWSAKGCNLTIDGGFANTNSGISDEVYMANMARVCSCK
ncbi:MAG: hypothetical protein EOP48_14270 [Sphingobacteriales bacterium]|nr:MAG: hypothetical protein EOP48_14270 [Sphingobacteriales bacterium]